MSEIIPPEKVAEEIKEEGVVRVLIGFPHEGMTPSETYCNRLGNIKHLGHLEERGRLLKQNPRFEFFQKTCGRMHVHVARDEMAKAALAMNADYLFMIDDDMIAPDDLFEQLYACDKDIVAPLAFTRNFPHKPVMYSCIEGWDPVIQKEHFTNYAVMNYPKNKLVHCDAVGFGAVLINMRVIRAMEAPYFMNPNKTGEDISFCSPDGIIYGDFNDVSVPSKEAITHTGRKEKIDQFHERQYNGDLVNIKPLYTESLRLTPNHPVLSGNKLGRKLNWIKAGDLKESDFLFFPKPRLNNYTPILDMTNYAFGAFISDKGIKFSRTHKKSPTIPLTVKMNKDIAWLFGFYVAEGNSTENNVCFAFNAKDEQYYANRVKFLMRKYFGIKNHIYSRSGNGGSIVFTSAILARFFKESFGHGARNKRFPKWIADNIKFSGQVLRGLWDGDGMMKFQHLSSTSRILVHQVKSLLAANDIFSSIRIGSNEDINYSLVVLAKDRKCFGDLVGVNLPDLKNLNRKNVVVRIKLDDSEGWRIPIQKISRESFSGKVFNAGVHSVNSYVLNGIAVHNCYEAKKKGFETWMDTRINLGHLSHPIIVTEAYVDAQKKAYGIDPKEFEKKYGTYTKYEKNGKESVLMLGE